MLLEVNEDLQPTTGRPQTDLKVTTADAFEGSGTVARFSVDDRRL